MRHALLFATLFIAGCASAPRPTPQRAFFDELSSLCGKAFAGQVVVDTPATAGPDPFREGPLVMHVRECTADTLRIPFHVGDDRSRTWVLRRTANGLRLKHDHRHSDGTPDALTQYGGDAVADGTSRRQEFPADDESRAMFVAQDRAISVDNVWALEIEPGRTFVYELARPGRLFRIRFDLSRPLTAPPAPWGADD